MRNLLELLLVRNVTPWAENKGTAKVTTHSRSTPTNA
jgi:hypothetical protein